MFEPVTSQFESMAQQMSQLTILHKLLYLVTAVGSPVGDLVSLSGSMTVRNRNQMVKSTGYPVHP